MSKKEKIIKRQKIENRLKELNPEIECQWLKKLNKREVNALWQALMQDVDDESLIRF